MMDRCYRPNHVKYKFYGGKGVTVYERWHDFWHFVEDIDNHMEDGHLLYVKDYQLDKDKNGGKMYSLNTCRVITVEENRRLANKKQMKRIVAVKGNESIGFESIASASRHLGIHKGSISRYLKSNKIHEWGYYFEFV